MKKIKLLILLLIVSIPMFVKADAGAPMITEYKIRISNKAGAIIYEWDEKDEKYIKTNEVLKYDNTYTVTHEYINNNQLYGSIYETIGEGDNETYKNYTINLSDAKPVKYNLEDYKQDSSQKYYVFESGVTLYQGPSKTYGKITPEVSLTVGTTLETKYYDQLWAYVEYQGIKGWIYTYGNSFDSPYEESSSVATMENDITVSLKTIDAVELYETPKSNKKVGMTIPANTELSNHKVVATYDVALKLENYYIEYNGIKGWLRLDIVNSNIAVIYNYSETFMIADYQGVKLYNSPNDEKNVIDTIPYLTELTPAIYTYWKDYHDYEKNHWLQVTYGNKIGWVKEETTESKNISFAYYINEEESIKINNPEGITLYENINDTQSKIATIPYESRINTTLYASVEEGTWYFTEYDNQEGWVFINYDEEENIEAEENDENIENDEEEENIDDEENSSNDSASDLNIGQKVLDYIIFVVILSLTATVTVILINKKKKEKNASK